MNSFGRIFGVSIFGESHGPAIGVVIDGCPAGLPLSVEEFEADLRRRRGGQAAGTTPRAEDDVPRFVSGVFDGKATGAPLCLEFDNKNIKSSDYASIRNTPRPGHADWVAWSKFGGHNDPRGGGHFSGRLTACLVAAGVIAKKIIAPASVHAELREVAGSTDIEAAVAAALAEGDSVGGIVGCSVDGLNPGLGSPFFDSLESLLSHAVFSVPAIKGIEFGSGFESARLRGSQMNDAIVDSSGQTKTNHAGGINGGISNGNQLQFRVAVKPTSSISKPQTTVNLVTGKQAELSVRGRHDACIALRVPVVIEAVTAMVLADCMLVEGKISRIWR